MLIVLLLFLAPLLIVFSLLSVFCFQLLSTTTQVQSKHFGDSLKVSIEGYAVNYYSDYRIPTPVPRMDFHSYLSDDRMQNSATVKWHMDHLIKLLLKNKQLKLGGRILATTDGCASQYRSGTSLYFQSVQAVEFNVILVRCYTEAGHGKSVVDAVNGVDKNIRSKAKPQPQPQPNPNPQP